MLLHPITINEQNVEQFAVHCLLPLRQRLLANAQKYPAGLNAATVVDANGTPLGLAFTLRNPNTDNEILQSLHTSVPLPEGREVLDVLLRQLINQGRLRLSRCITATVFFKKENDEYMPLPPYELLLQICADAGFEKPVPLKVIHKICVDLLQPEKYLFAPEGLECRFMSFKEWNEERGGLLPEHLPPHPPALTPLIPGCDPVISQLLVKDGRIRGWLTAQRISQQSMYYQTLFVDEEMQKHYAAPLLIRRAVAMQIENHYSDYAIFGAPMDNPVLVKMLVSHWKECSVEIIQESTVAKLLCIQ
jgi:hypothetical protein